MSAKVVRHASTRTSVILLTNGHIHRPTFTLPRT